MLIWLQNFSMGPPEKNSLIYLQECDKFTFPSTLMNDNLSVDNLYIPHKYSHRSMKRQTHTQLTGPKVAITLALRR